MNTVEQIDRKVEFEAQGYIICRNFFSEEEISKLLVQLQAAQADGQGSLSKNNMTFYSQLFRQNPALQAFICKPKVVELLAEIIGPNIWVRWDQAVEKRPGGEEFPWHQDSGYSHLQEPYYQFWIAISDMTPENGGLWVQPGSHKYGILPHEWLENHLVSSKEVEKPIFIEAKKGDIVIFSSFLLHRTLPNTSSDTRWAYVVECMSLDYYDPFIEPPYFIVARDGMPSSEWTRFDRGWLSPKNQIKYFVPTLRSSVRKSKVWKKIKYLKSTLNRS